MARPNTWDFSAASPPGTTPLPLGIHEGFMLRAAVSIEKQAASSSRQRAIESWGSEGLQSPTDNNIHSDSLQLCFSNMIGMAESSDRGIKFDKNTEN